jgi:hypothetical protein
MHMHVILVDGRPTGRIAAEPSSGQRNLDDGGRQKEETVTVRTTVEIKDEHRAQLLELAARRGKKGFSDLIEEALEMYLDALRSGEQARKRAAATRGTLSAKQADDLRARARELRASWR